MELYHLTESTDLEAVIFGRRLSPGPPPCRIRRPSPLYPPIHSPALNASTWAARWVSSRAASARHCQTYAASERATSIRNASASVRDSTIGTLPNTVRVQAPAGNAVQVEVQRVERVDAPGSARSRHVDPEKPVRYIHDTGWHRRRLPCRHPFAFRCQHQPFVRPEPQRHPVAHDHRAAWRGAEQHTQRHAHRRRGLRVGAHDPSRGRRGPTNRHRSRGVSHAAALRCCRRTRLP